LRTPENFALCEVRPKATRLWKLDRFLKKSSAKTFADGFINKLKAALKNAAQSVAKPHFRRGNGVK